MRNTAALALIAALALAPAATAQNNAAIRAEPPLTATPLAASNILDGTWRVTAPGGQLTLTTRPNNGLEGTYVAGMACLGRYDGPSFILLCSRADIGTFVFLGKARETPPVATQRGRRTSIAIRPAAITGTFFEPVLSDPADPNHLPHLDGGEQFTANRN